MRIITLDDFTSLAKTQHHKFSRFKTSLGFAQFQPVRSVVAKAVVLQMWMKQTMWAPASL